MKKNYFVFFLFSFLILLLLQGDHAFASEASIYIVDPPMASANISSIAIRGSGWGIYNDRLSPRAWFVDPQSPELREEFELTLYRNYRDCSFIKNDATIIGSCLLEKDELFARFTVPTEVQERLEPKKYGIYVRTENGIDALGVFTVLAKPTLDTAKDPAIAIIPDHGPVKTYTVLFGAGFPQKPSIDLRFDGIWSSLGGTLWADENGTFENIGFSIPSFITKEGKSIAITPGKHTVRLSNGTNSAEVTFVVDGIDEKQKKEEELKKKKEQEEKERLEKEEKKLKEEQEKIKKEEERLEKERKKLEQDLKRKKEEEQKKKNNENRTRLEKERKKLEKNLKKKKEQEEKLEHRIGDIDKRKEQIKDKFCDTDVPITFQPGCVQRGLTSPKSEFEGEPCRADNAITFQSGCRAQDQVEQKMLFEGMKCSTNLPITFQPGCTSRTPDEPVKLFVGKLCDQNLPRVWQEGCIDPSVKTGIAPSGKPYCNPNIPTYSQSSCEPQEPQVHVEKKSYTGKPCDQNLPRFWQEGCIDTEAVEEPKSYSGKPCNPNLPLFWQTGCIDQEAKKSRPNRSSIEKIGPFVGKSCDFNLPRVWQEGCVEI